MPMLEFLREKATGRKLRLFACACCRRAWDLFTDPRARTAVETAEREADGQQDDGAWASAAADARTAYAEALDKWVHGLAVRATERDAWTAAHGCATAWSSRWHKSALVAIVRDLFANPYRPCSVAPAWLVWNDAIIPKLAQGIYEDRAFDGLPVLADALEEAGCLDAALLGHLRGPGPHARGCWAVDLLLKKE
jgi:hypothetical protein